MPKTEFLQIRLTPKDRQRIERAAAADHLDTSTWARRVLLKHLDVLEDENKRAAEPVADSRSFVALGRQRYLAEAAGGHESDPSIVTGAASFSVQNFQPLQAMPPMIARPAVERLVNSLPSSRRQRVVPASLSRTSSQRVTPR
jgi:hypothetical protein